MTSSHPPVTNTPTNANAPSFAGAAKKPAATPVVATGSSQPVLAAGSSVSASPAHHAKSPSVASPMNGSRPNSIMPAVPTVGGAPAVAHGTSSLNGDQQARKPAPAIANANPNPTPTNPASAPVPNKPSGLQFGGLADSPQIPHSTPSGGSAPMAIPGGDRVTEPRNSPSPIPQPLASGGRPPSGAHHNPMTQFGSFESERPHLRTPSMSHAPLDTASPHMRRASSHSQADMNPQMPQQGNMGRGNFQQGRGGRGGYYNQQSNMGGYPPNNNFRGAHAGGRGGMPSNFNGGRGHFVGTPPQQHRSPAMAHAMPHQPPHIPQGMPNYSPYYQGPPAPPPQVQPPAPLPPSSFEQAHHVGEYSNGSNTGRSGYKHGKKKGPYRGNERVSSTRSRPDYWQQDNQEYGQGSRQYFKRRDFHGRSSRDQDWTQHRGVALPPLKTDMAHLTSDHPSMMSYQPPFSAGPPFAEPRSRGAPIDLSPESGNFENLLTRTHQNYYPGYDPSMGAMGRAMPGPNNMPGYPVYPVMHANQTPPHQYGHQFGQPPYNAPGGAPMSRNGSQVSANDNRPTSSTSQTQPPVVASGTPQPHLAQMNQPPTSQSHISRPPKRQSAAIAIKNPLNGEDITIPKITSKPSSSPAPPAQASTKTPPVAPAATPTPPSKPSTPAHGRSESTANAKSAEETKNEFMKIVRQAVAKSEDKPASEAKPAIVSSRDVEKAPETQKAEETSKPAEISKAEDAPKAEDASESLEKVADEAAKQENDAATAAAEAPQPEEDDMERQIREMEEAEAKREAEAAAYEERKAAEKKAKAAADEENRQANAAENDRKLREQEAEMERLEEEKARKRQEREISGKSVSVATLIEGRTPDQVAKPTDPAGEAANKLAALSMDDKDKSAGPKASPSGRGPKPAALNLAPLKTNSVEPPQPSAALHSLKTARLLDVIKTDIYPPGISSPNPALNSAVAKKGTSFKYDTNFLLQFKGVFTEVPSLDFHQQVKSLIGDGDGGRSASVRTPAGGSGRQGSRGGSSFVMGSFNAPAGGRTIPAGTTSAQRFEASNGGRPPMGGMGSFGGGPRAAFPSGHSMSRTSSSANMGNIPNSPRQGSRRNASRQTGMNAKAEEKAAKTMPLTAGMKIETLQTSNTGWKPLSLGKAPQPSGASDLLDPPTVQRKVKAALNKMTPENFDKISNQILTIAAQSRKETDGRTLRQVIQLTFEKATDEAHWASMYASFCQRMLEMMSPEIRDESITDRRTGQVVSGGALFRKYLLNRCQEEFERGWKVEMPEAKDGKSMEAAMLSDEYYIAAAAKRRGLGLVQFIGELYKLGMLTERIMHECIKKLVDFQGMPDEGEVESLTKLLRTIGGALDQADRGKAFMDVYFDRINTMVQLPGLPSRLQFMLMDVVDLRKMNWRSKEANKGPKKLEEIKLEAEAAAAQKAMESQRSNQRGGPAGRPHMGRGDARGYSNFPPPVPNQVGMDDLRRLKGGANRASSSGMTLGPGMSLLSGSRSNSGRRLGPGGSLSRGGEDSGASSRTGTPPVKEQSSSNAFSLLANMESDNPGSPPSTAASPALPKAVPDTAAKGKDSS